MMDHGIITELKPEYQYLGSNIDNCGEIMFTKDNCTGFSKRVSNNWSWFIL